MRYRRNQKVNKKLSLFAGGAEGRGAFGALPLKQRGWMLALMFGSVFPLFLMGVVQPVYWLVAFQLACVAGMLFIGWRTPALGGSPVVFGTALLASLASFTAAFAL